MAEQTKIQWTDYTFDPWRGCTKVAAGCANCYAEATSKRNPGVLGVWGPNGKRVVAAESYWRQPKKWNFDAAFSTCCNYQLDNGRCSRCQQEQQRPRVFCASLADVFEDWEGPVSDTHGDALRVSDSEPLRWVPESVPFDELLDHERRNIELGHYRRLTMHDVCSRLFSLIDATPHLDWLLLTKRPERIRERWNAVDDRPAGRLQKHRPNVWLGTSVATQADADRNIPELLKCRDLSPCLFVSYEPALELVDFRFWNPANPQSEGEYMAAVEGVGVTGKHRPVDWLIVGGESGPHARPCDVTHLVNAIDQGEMAKVACFVKQLGAHVYDYRASSPMVEDQRWPAGTRIDGNRVILRHPKGGDPAEWAESLRVREFPRVCEESQT